MPETLSRRESEAQEKQVKLQEGAPLTDNPTPSPLLWEFINRNRFHSAIALFSVYQNCCGPNILMLPTRPLSI
jgi:hypothetical protein